VGVTIRRTDRLLATALAGLLLAGTAAGCSGTVAADLAAVTTAASSGAPSEGPAGDPAASTSLDAPDAASATPSDRPSVDPTDGPSVDPTRSPAPAPSPSPVLVPLVPVTGSWSTERSITRAALVAAITGQGPHPREVLVSAEDLAPLVAALGVKAAPNVRALSAGDIRARIAKSPTALGIVRAEDVSPAVRVLAVGGAALFGETRVRSVAAWPLLIPEPHDARPSTFAPASLWTMVAGGDVMLDRYVYKRTVIDRLGAGYPWNGGTARITSTYCCGWPGLRIVRGTRVGSAGAVRNLLRRADVALVNLEGPAPDTHRWHPHGLVFTMDPALLTGLRGAGIDVVSLANNHIRNGGSRGVLDTIRNLDELGIRHAGAGRNSIAARRPAWLSAAGLRIAVLAYNGVGSAPNATSTTAGAAALSLAAIRADIRAARAAGADVVVVVPHWGVEYTDRITQQQAALGPALLRAGADLVLGGHSHWAGPIRVTSGRLVVYSMGNLVFDLMHDARTQQGMLVELTFAGRKLAQVTLHPTVIVDAVQPNLLTASGGGNVLLRAIQASSARLGSP
jgi:poly-gamma-glutamate capsule biosynthesis protein CapA/YwtB (metallophosphatase superfamily)